MTESDAGVVIVGAGGFGRETAELVRSLADARGGRPCLVGFVDDDPLRHGQDVAGAPVLGGLSWLGPHREVVAVVGVASSREPGSRLRVAARSEARWTTLVHPSVTVPRSVTLGAGTVVHAGTVFTADVCLGNHVAVMPGVVFTHDDVVGDGAVFGAGVMLAGGVTVGAGAYIGSGALVREGLRIGDGAVVGMGSVVTHDVPAGETWAGVPARPFRRCGS